MLLFVCAISIELRILSTHGGEGYSNIIAIFVGVAAKGMIFRQFSLAKCVEIRKFLSRIGYGLPKMWPVYR